MFIKDTEKYNIHFKEYINYVKTNLRFPTNETLFSDGIKMNSWRNNQKNHFKNDEVINFDKSMETEIENNKKNLIKIQKDEIFFKDTFKDLKEDDPHTLSEYLKGNNRFMYFGIQEYILSMNYIGEVNEYIPYLKLLRDVHYSNLQWSDLYKRCTLETLICQMNKLMFKDIKESDMNIIRHLYGLDDYSIITLKEYSMMFNVSRSRISQIINKILRQMRHPSRNIFRNRINNIKLDKPIKKYGHWFILEFKTNLGKNINSPKLIKRHYYEPIEDILKEFGYDYNDENIKYRIKSIKTYTNHQFNVPLNILDEFGMTTQQLSENNEYDYTIIRLEEIEILPFEFYIEDILLEQKRRLITETYKNQMYFGNTSIGKMYNTKSIRDQIEDQLRIILNSITFDNDYEWISVFNQRIRNIGFKIDHKLMIATVLKSLLNEILCDFHIRIYFIPFGKNDYITLELQKNDYDE